MQSNQNSQLGRYLGYAFSILIGLALLAAVAILLVGGLYKLSDWAL